MKSLFALNDYIWKYRRLLFLGILFVVISNFFTVYPAQIVRNAINISGELLDIYELYEGTAVTESIKPFIIQSLIFFGIILVVVTLIRGVFLFFTRQTLIVMSRKIEYDQRNDLFDHFQSLSLSFYRNNRTGDLMARITEDVNRVRMYLGPGIMYTLNTATLFAIVVVTMFVVSPELTLYALIPLPLLSLLIYLVESFVLQRSEKIQEQLSHMTTFTQEMFSGIRVVKAYVKESASVDKFSEETETYKNKSMGLARVDALFFPLVVFLVGLSDILTIWIGGRKVVAGELTIGNIAEFIIYISLLTWPIISLGWVTTLIQRAAASQKRLNELLGKYTEVQFVKDGKEITHARMAFEDVSFTYKETGIAALQDVSFTLQPGQKLGIVGPTGSGKSTLCMLISRLYDVDTGTIYLDNAPINAYSKEKLRNAIGYAPQDVFLFSETIKGNISFGKLDASQEEVETAARWSEIHENIMSFPEQFETLVGERGVTLSGGQKQRTSIARAWIRIPKFLILDDVLSAVDTGTEERILSQLRAYRQQHEEVAVIMTAHRISAIQDSDLILVLEKGKVVESGTHDQLIAAAGYYARIFEKQMLELQSPV